jgi:uracil phosphoribosyltransferase
LALITINNPLILSKVSILRNKKTDSVLFRKTIFEISALVSSFLFNDLLLERINIETPLIKTSGWKVKEKIILLPILRAGLTVTDGILSVFNNVTVGSLGLFRDEKTLRPHNYFFKLPKLDNETTIIINDVLLATGGSVDYAINKIKALKPKRIKLFVIIASLKGLQEIQKNHPYVDIYVIEIDKSINNDGYILPGLGDAGDRIFGTK